MIHAFIKKGSFQDSVSLMLISRKLSESPKVEEISVMMGTPANKSLLEVTGFWHPQFREGANKRGNSSRLTQSFHFFMFEPIFSPVNALNQPI